MPQPGVQAQTAAQSEIENAIIADYARRVSGRHLSSMRLPITLMFVFLCAGGSPHLLAAPKNMILIIGDGLDDQHVTMGRNYLEQTPHGSASIPRVGTGRDPVPRR